MPLSLQWSVNDLPVLPSSHRKAHLPGWVHGPHGTLPLLHLHPSKLLATPIGATCWHRYHAQGLRLWEHPPDLWVLRHVPLSASNWVWKEPLENRILSKHTGVLTLISLNSHNSPKRRHCYYCHGATGQQGSSENIELHIFYIQQKSSALSNVRKTLHIFL